MYQVLGTPSEEVLAKFKRNGAAHVNFDFPAAKGIGISQLVPHASAECVDLITRLLRYDWSERMTAREALRHPYFRETRELDARATAAAAAAAAAGTKEVSSADDHITSRV
jgi:renal tumor antigen